MLDPNTGLRLVNLRLNVQKHHAPRARVDQLLERSDQPQHLKMFNALAMQNLMEK
ncbi:hypothetical protein ACVWYH_000020 [Bradyrhizobium sp. GM24.11]